MAASWKSHLDVFDDLDPEDERALRDALDSCRQEDAIRALLTTILLPSVKLGAPDQVDDYQRFIARFPTYSTFAHMPTGELLLRLAYAAHLIDPGSPLQEATNALVLERSRELNAMPIFKPIFLACDGDFARFMDNVPGTAKLIFKAGKASMIHNEPGDVLLYYENLPALPNQYFAIGYNAGLMEAFDLVGHTEVELISLWSYEIRMVYRARSA